MSELSVGLILMLISSLYYWLYFPVFLYIIYIKNLPLQNFPKQKQHPPKPKPRLFGLCIKEPQRLKMMWFSSSTCACSFVWLISLQAGTELGWVWAVVLRRLSLLPSSIVKSGSRVKSVVFVKVFFSSSGICLPTASFYLPDPNSRPSAPHCSANVLWKTQLCTCDSTRPDTSCQPEWLAEALMVSFPSSAFCCLSRAWFSLSLCPDSEKAPREGIRSQFQFFLERPFPLCNFIFY